MDMPDAIALIVASISAFLASIGTKFASEAKKSVRQVCRSNDRVPVVTEARLKEVERQCRELEAEWSSMYSKFSKTLKSLQQREYREGKRGEESPGGGDPVGSPDGDPHLAILNLWRKRTKPES
jgi:hypothetical protein